MRKSSKIIVVCFLLLVVGTLSVSAREGLRLGLEFGNPIAVVIIRPAPFDFKVGYDFREGNQNIFVSADYRLVSGYQVIDFLHVFMGLGIYSQIYFEDRGDDQGQFDLGARIPLGLQAFLFKSAIEIFLELAPTINFVPSVEVNQLDGWHGYAGFTIRLPL